MRLEVVQGDITREQVDAIVNAANESLLGGGGVDGAIHRAAGPAILEECRALGGCATGDVKATGARRPGGTLRPPRGRPGLARRNARRGRPARLAAIAARSSWHASSACSSVAFPAISTGVYGYPVDRAAIVALATIREHARPPVELVRVVCFSEPSLQAFEAARADAGHTLGRCPLPSVSAPSSSTTSATSPPPCATSRRRI